MRKLHSDMEKMGANIKIEIIIKMGANIKTEIIITLNIFG